MWRLAGIALLSFLGLTGFKVGGGGGSLSGTTYYVSSAASGSGNGLSTGSPWTMAQANSGAFNGGDTVLYTGTFSGAGISWGVANQGSSPTPSSSTPVTVGVYGGGATIASTGSNNCVSLLNIAAIKFQSPNITCVGDGTANIDAILVETTNSGTAKLEYLYLAGFDISGYGRNAILFLANTPSFAGYNNVTITGNDIHGNSVNGAGGGIATASTGSTGVGATNPAFTNFEISYNSIHDNLGTTGQKSGTGAVCGQCGTVTMEHNTVTNNGQNSTTSDGPVGLWCYDSSNCTYQFNEVSFEKTASGSDGDGIDCDGGVVGCLIEFNYTHDNYGAGILSFPSSFVSYDNSGLIIRWNISQNDGVNDGYAGLPLAANGRNNNGVEVYQNTVYTTGSTAAFMTFFDGSTITGRVNNNIFYSTGDLLFNVQSNHTGLLLDGNDYFTTGTFGVAWGGTNYSSLSAWKAANTEQETVNGGFTSNPGLVSPGSGGSGMTNGYQPSLVAGYQLRSGAAMLGVGINLQSQFSINPGTSDYFGNTVPNGGGGTGYNVGAYGGP